MKQYLIIIEHNVNDRTSQNTYIAYAKDCDEIKQKSFKLLSILFDNIDNTDTICHINTWCSFNNGEIAARVVNIIDLSFDT